MKNKQIELETILLPHKQPEQLDYSASFPIPIKQLCDLFEPDNIREGQSLRIVRGWGGMKGLQKLLKTSLKNGIQGDFHDRTQRIDKYGSNAAIVRQMPTIFDMIMQNFEDLTLRILCLAATVSLILGILTHGIKEGWLEGASILLAVVIIVAVTSVNNYMKQQQFRKLNETAEKSDINVLRNGMVENISVYDLVVGDIIQIQTGEILSVDGIVFNSKKVQVDESSVNGESDLIAKSDIKENRGKDDKIQNPFLVSGSRVMNGTCMMIVLAVGINSRSGISRLKLQKKSDETPLEQKLEELANQIGNIGIISAVLTFIALLFHFFIDRFSAQQCFICYDSLNVLVDYFIICVTILVVAIPEGLPLAVTLSLAYSVGKMAKEQNLVRFLQACQTMGGVNNICTDKTGTLTKNSMTVTRLWAQENFVDEFKKKALRENTVQLLCVGAAVNADAYPQVDATGKFQQIGNKTQCALLQMAYLFGYDFRKIRKNQSIKYTIPFSSQRKKMSTIYESNAKKLIIFTKGAPDFLLPICSSYISSTGEPRKIDSQFTQNLEAVISQFSSQSLRTLLLCYRYVDNRQIDPENLDKLENQLIIIGLVGIKDPLRPGIPEAVRMCKKAGIIVRMVTGDNIETAIAIAKQAQIIPNNYVRPNLDDEDVKGKYIVMEGKSFRTLVGGLKPKQKKQDKDKQRKEGKNQQKKEQEKKQENGDQEKKCDGKCHKQQQQQQEQVVNVQKFTEIVKQLRVLARSSPQDKYLLATGLKQLKNVVAMTGDGTNDAPALKKADIGFAMGIAGTKVAKQAAGIILLDDNFSSILTAAKYGRNIFECIRKFLQFQLTINLVAVFMVFLGAAVIDKEPLTAIQMLWINLIMDTLAALALATEPPSDQLLQRMPYRRRQNIISPEMWRNIVFHFIFQIVVLTIVLFKGDKIFGVESQLHEDNELWTIQKGKHLTLFFNIFVFLQIFNFFNARKLKKSEINAFSDMCNNNLFLSIVLGIFILQLLLVQYGGKVFKLVPLSIEQHLICIAIGFLSIINGIITKLFIPESWLNQFTLFHVDQNKPYNVDKLINKLIGKSMNLRRSVANIDQRRQN